MNTAFHDIWLYSRLNTLWLLVFSIAMSGSPIFERTARRLFSERTDEPTSPQPMQHAIPRLLPDLGSAYKSLRSGVHPRAVIVGPFITIVREIEQAARAGTDIVLLTTAPTARNLAKRFSADLLGGKIVMRQSPSDKQLHDKAILLQNRDGSWDGYFGSANPSYNQFRSNELVARLHDLGKGSAPLIAYIQRLSRLSQSPNMPKRAPGAGRERMLHTMKHLQTGQETNLNTQELTSFVGTDPVPMIVQHVSPTEPCRYKMSSMGLNHPGVFSALHTALQAGSSVQLLLDKDAVARALRNPQSEISRLVQLQRSFPATLQIGTATGQGKTGIHHPKLFIRICDDDALAMHMTNNLTTQAAGQTNYSLTVPSWPPSNWPRIKKYIEQFDTWWRTAQEVQNP